MQTHCYYHGEVEGYEDSMVALSTCSGLRSEKSETYEYPGEVVKECGGGPLRTIQGHIIMSFVMKNFKSTRDLHHLIF